MGRHGPSLRLVPPFSRRLQNRLENIDSILLPHSRRLVRAVAVSVLIAPPRLTRKTKEWRRAWDSNSAY